MAAEPFLGVALPDAFPSDDKASSSSEGGDSGSAPSGAQDTAEAPAGGDEGTEVGNAQKDSKEAPTPEITKQAIQNLLDLDKHERFRWQGRELTRKDLESGFMMRQDYSKKTQELAEARKYADNFDVDLHKVLGNPELIDQFKKVYPPSYVKMAERILERLNPPQAGAPTSGGNAATSDLKLVEKLLQEKLAPVLAWKEQVDQSVIQANTQRNLEWLDSQHEKLKTKYPFGSDKEVDLQLSAYLEQAGAKGNITDKLMDTLYKRSHEERKAQFDTHYKKQQAEQLAANSKSKDVGSGAGAEAKGSKRKTTMAEAKKALLERFE